MKTKLSLYSFAVTALLLSCNQDSGQVKQEPKAANATPKTNPTATPRETPTNTPISTPTGGLVGNWATACTPTPQGSGAMKIQILFTTTGATSTVSMYMDSACKSLGLEQKAVQTYKVGKASSAVSGAMEIDYSITKNTTKYVSASDVTSANQNVKTSSIAACEAVVYKVNTETDDTACGPKAIYSLYKISGTTLTVGDCEQSQGGCQSAAGRPTKLSTMIVYQKSL